MPCFSVDMTSNPFISALSSKDCAYLHDKISHTRFLASDAHTITLAESKLYDAGKTMVYIIRILMDYMQFSSVSISIDDVAHRVDSILNICDISEQCKRSGTENMAFDTFAIRIEYMQHQVEDLYLGKYVIIIMDRGIPIGRLAYEQNDHDIMTYDMNFPAPSQLLADILQSIMSVF